MSVHDFRPRFQFPKKLRFLFEAHRYKVAYGGRGSAKSWSFARALLIRGAEAPMRWLCAREVQKSIKQSVHTLLSDQINEMGYGNFYEILDTEIRARNGTLFSFAGLAAHTVESIKSFEGYDGVWVEEAQTVRKKSWNILIPTIRKDGSEIWASFNPDMDTDDTYVRFVTNTPPDCAIQKVSFRDNPWFPPVLEEERKHAQRTMPKDEYENIWEGHCRAAVEGAIYADEIRAAQEKGRVRNVPYDPMLKVHVVFDLGWNDSMFIILVQRLASELRVIEALEDDHRTLDSYSAELKEKRLNWGKVWIPHDGEHADYKTGKSSRAILTKLGWDVAPEKDIEKLDVESGIRVARMTFPRVYFDKVNAAPLVNALKRYRRHVNQNTEEPSSPLHDAASHGADCFRYMAVSADRMRNEETKAPPKTRPYKYRDRAMGS